MVKRKKAREIISSEALLKVAEFQESFTRNVALTVQVNSELPDLQFHQMWRRKGMLEKGQWKRSQETCLLFMPPSLTVKSREVIYLGGLRFPSGERGGLVRCILMSVTPARTVWEIH